MSLRNKILNIPPSWHGVRILWREEYSFRFLAICGAITLLLSYIIGISRIELLFIILTFGILLSLEAINTAIEEICDHVTPEHHATIGKIKDMASGATLIMLCVTGAVCLAIFMPYIAPFL